MINRNKNTHSYDQAINVDQNKIVSNFKKEHKLKIYTSPKMKNIIKEKILEPKIINETQKEPFVKLQIKSPNYEQNNNIYDSTEKDEFELCLSKKNKNKINLSLKNYNNKNEEYTNINLYTIKNKGNVSNKDFVNNKFFYNNKTYYFKKEDEKNNNNDEQNKFTEYNNETKNKELFNHSLIGFRHSNYSKYRKEREKNKGIYMSKRYNRIIEDNNFCSQKEVKIYPSRNKNNLMTNDNIYINELLLKEGNKNKDINNNRESSQNNKQITKNYSEINEEEEDLKKANITGYRYKVSNRYKKYELKNKFLSEINTIKNQLLNTEYDKKGKSLINIKKEEINKCMESNYGTTSKLNNNNSNDYKYNSVDKYYSNNNEKDSKVISNINNNNLESKRNYSLENSYQKQDFLISPSSLNNNISMNNNINKSINYNNCPTDGNIYRTNDICIENISIIPIKNRTNIKGNNIKEYKYNYYLHKKNKKLQKLKEVYKVKKKGDIDNLINDLLRIKNSKKKRFHRNINKTEEEILYKE